MKLMDFSFFSLYFYVVIFVLLLRDEFLFYFFVFALDNNVENNKIMYIVYCIRLELM